MANLAADGSYARSIMRRALRIGLPHTELALRNGFEQGDIEKPMPDPVNAFFFVHSVGAMMALGQLHAPPTLAYAGNEAEIVDQALAFCLRGLGFTPAYVMRALKRQDSGEKQREHGKPRASARA
jgi:hypothetical protein